MGKPRLLVVEDEALSSLHTATKLRKRGYEVEEVATGEKAVARVAAGGIDLVLMDIALGQGIDGLEAARAILRSRELPIIFLSVHSDDETVAKASAIGSYGFVSKDSGIGILDASIKMALGLFEARAARTAANAELAEANAELEEKVEALKTINESLAASESRSTKLFEQNPAAMIITRGSDGFIIDVNETFCRLFGRIRKEFVGSVTLPRGVDLWNEPEDRGRYVRSLEKGGIVDDFDAEFKRRDGSRFLGAISGRYIEVEGERYMLSLIKDVTEKRAAQEALERLARVQAVATKAMQLVLRETDEELLLEGVCRVAVESGGMRMAWVGFIDEATGSVRPAANAGFVEGYLDRLRVSMRAVPEGLGPIGRSIREMRPIASPDIATDSSMVTREEALARGYRSAASFPLRWGPKVIGVLACYSGEVGSFGEVEIKIIEQLALDLSFALNLHRVEREKVEAERKMRAHEALYRESFLQSSAVKFLLDPATGAIEDANEAASTFYGYPLDELKRMRITQINASDESNTRANMGLALSKTQNRFQFRHRLASGEIRDVEVFSSPIELAGQVYLHSIVHDITETKRAEEELERTAREKETLMKELQHRVKNNLNVVAALLGLEAGNCRDEKARAAFESSIDRVHAIASIYEKLYASADLSSIDLGPYAEELAASLFETYNLDPNRITLKTDFDELRLDSKRCVPFGLVLSELVSNALKYAYPEGARGEVRVSLKTSDGQARLSVSDDGIGIPEEKRSSDYASMGLSLVRMLAQQLGGEFSLDSARGTEAALSFPL
jgi:PAS domain S-box